MVDSTVSGTTRERFRDMVSTAHSRRFQAFVRPVRIGMDAHRIISTWKGNTRPT